VNIEGKFNFVILNPMAERKYELVAYDAKQQSINTHTNGDVVVRSTDGTKILDELFTHMNEAGKKGDRYVYVIMYRERNEVWYGFRIGEYEDVIQISRDNEKIAKAIDPIMLMMLGLQAK
jgi:hypothetical protein